MPTAHAGPQCSDQPASEAGTRRRPLKHAARPAGERVAEPPVPTSVPRQMKTGEEAVSRWVFPLYLAAAFVVALGYGVVLPIVPLLVERIVGVASPAAVAWHTGALSAVYMLAILVGAPLWGALSDRVGRRPVIMTGLAGYASRACPVLRRPQQRPAHRPLPPAGRLAVVAHSQTPQSIASPAVAPDGEVRPSVASARPHLPP